MSGLLKTDLEQSLTLLLQAWKKEMGRSFLIFVCAILTCGEFMCVSRWLGKLTIYYSFLQSTVRVALICSLFVVMAGVSTAITMKMACVMAQLTVQMDPMNSNVAVALDY
jgi:hypothetical protein